MTDGGPKAAEAQLAAVRFPSRRAAVTVMVCKFDLEPTGGDLRQVLFRIPALSSARFPLALARNLWRAQAADAIFVSNPETAELVFLYLAKVLYGGRVTTLVFDLIMRPLRARSGSLSARIKRKLLTAIDTFICIHKDTSGYEQSYGLRRERCEYVPFKANNFDLIGKLVEKDGDYAVALGASHRDYRLLVDAVRDLKIAVKIILPRASIRAHDARIEDSELPPNVEHVDTPVDRLRWSKYIAESRLVVVPILPGVIQPAGISVYLEAMLLGKPVIVTRGASTEGILDDRRAVLVTAADREALREAIVEVWNNEPLRRRLSEEGRRYALSLGDHSRLVADLRAAVQRSRPRC